MVMSNYKDLIYVYDSLTSRNVKEHQGTLRIPHRMSSSRSFNYSESCELEVHCSPFGLSGIYIKIADSDAVGIGSTMARLSGFTNGEIYYNQPKDLINAKYKLYGLLEENDVLRIDFIKIFSSKDEEEEQQQQQSQKKGKNGKEIPSENPGDEGYEVPDIVFRGKVPAGKPEVVEPFIGIFSFEKLPN